jgi:hypothetical protein
MDTLIVRCLNCKKDFYEDPRNAGHVPEHRCQGKICANCEHSLNEHFGITRFADDQGSCGHQGCKCEDYVSPFSPRPWD